VRTSCTAPISAITARLMLGPERLGLTWWMGSRWQDIESGFTARSLRPSHPPLTCGYGHQGLFLGSRRPLCVRGRRISGPKNPRTGAENPRTKMVGAVTPTVYLDFRALTRHIRVPTCHRRLPHRWHRTRWLTEPGLLRFTQSNAVARFTPSKTEGPVPCYSASGFVSSPYARRESRQHGDRAVGALLPAGTSEVYFGADLPFQESCSVSSSLPGSVSVSWMPRAARAARTIRPSGVVPYRLMWVRSCFTGSGRMRWSVSHTQCGASARVSAGLCRGRSWPRPRGRRRRPGRSSLVSPLHEHSE
jgi:hypothetical protein